MIKNKKKLNLLFLALKHNKKKIKNNFFFKTNYYKQYLDNNYIKWSTNNMFSFNLLKKKRIYINSIKFYEKNNK